MKNINSGAFWTVLVIAVLMAGFVGHLLFPTEVIKTQTRDVIKEVPVNVTVVKEVKIADPSALRDSAVGEFLKAADNGEDPAGNSVDVLTCDSHEFDFSDVSVKKVLDEWNVSFDTDKSVVSFDVRMRYKEADLESCTQQFHVDVTNEAGEDTIVEVA